MQHRHHAYQEQKNCDARRHCSRPDEGLTVVNNNQLSCGCVIRAQRLSEQVKKKKKHTNEQCQKQTTSIMISANEEMSKTEASNTACKREHKVSLFPDHACFFFFFQTCSIIQIDPKRSERSNAWSFPIRSCDALFSKKNRAATMKNKQVTMAYSKKDTLTQDNKKEETQKSPSKSTPTPLSLAAPAAATVSPIAITINV
jgi:hypothetical protein